MDVATVVDLGRWRPREHELPCPIALPKERRQLLPEPAGGEGADHEGRHPPGRW